MAGTGKWILGGVIGATALYALVVASHTHSQGIYLAGLAYAGFAVLFIMGLISRSYDKLDSGR
ncbi:MAG: hypothetical protein EXQ95_02730 [Alphaproteobacteria bacterium]|nr:hypothetical protein [Alphaproteobacteria bacterium]